LKKPNLISTTVSSWKSTKWRWIHHQWIQNQQAYAY